MPISKELFRNEYRIPSNRLKGWDYTMAGYYFVTICTRDRIPWFGEIKENQVILSEVGEIVNTNLLHIPVIYRSVILDAWMVMPNHVHTIIVLGEKKEVSVETPHWGVSTKDNWKPGSLGSIINQYKSACTKQIRAMGCKEFAWQDRYYDHIIQKDKELDNIRAYILNNPTKWVEDEYYKMK